MAARKFPSARPLSIVLCFSGYRIRTRYFAEVREMAFRKFARTGTGKSVEMINLECIHTHRRTAWPWLAWTV